MRVSISKQKYRGKRRKYFIIFIIRYVLYTRQRRWCNLEFFKETRAGIIIIIILCTCIHIGVYFKTINNYWSFVNVNVVLLYRVNTRNDNVCVCVGVRSWRYYNCNDF